MLSSIVHGASIGYKPEEGMTLTLFSEDGKEIGRFILATKIAIWLRDNITSQLKSFGVKEGGKDATEVIYGMTPVPKVDMTNEFWTEPQDPTVFPPMKDGLIEGLKEGAKDAK